ncbi:DUF397 domain-containing protein [Streptomyces deserti]
MGKSSLQWRKSSASAQYGDCVEVAVRGRVMVRNSTRPDREILSVPLESWTLFIRFVSSDFRRPDKSE